MHELYNDIPVGRIRLLPEGERQPFDHWLRGQTRPLIDDLPMEEQDYFYWWDYEKWRAGLPVTD